VDECKPLAAGRWVIPPAELVLGRRIGRGSFGEVFTADWQGTEVALKQMNDKVVRGAAVVGRCRLTLSKPTLKAPGTKRLSLECDEPLSNFLSISTCAATPWRSSRVRFR
jgi:hypothetical protein